MVPIDRCRVDDAVSFRCSWCGSYLLLVWKPKKGRWYFKKEIASDFDVQSGRRSFTFFYHVLPYGAEDITNNVFGYIGVAHN